MRVASRFMPPAPGQRTGLWGYAFLAGLALFFLYLVVIQPVAIGALLLAAAALGILNSKKQRDIRQRLLKERPSADGICRFARAFDLKEVDTWVVRAVYEELQAYLLSIKLDVAISADDDIVEYLGIDSDELDMGIAQDIAARTGRTLDGIEKNPLYGKVRTAKDLVVFFNTQPRAAQQTHGARRDG